jgi:hypothetical protein
MVDSGKGCIKKLISAFQFDNLAAMFPLSAVRGAAV